MARILLGSSNIKRFYKSGKSENYRVELATVFRAFEVVMETVKDNDRVIISVLENFIEKAVNRADDNQRLDKMGVVMEKFMVKISEVSKKFPTAKIVLAYPILRPANEWMTEMEDQIRQEFEKAYNKQCLLNITKIDAISRGGQVFEKDGVHLTAAAGKNFVQNLIEMAEVAFEAEHCEVEDDDDESFMGRMEAAAKDSDKERSLKCLQQLRNDSIEAKNWRKGFESMLNSRFMNDNVMFARLRDEVDSEANRKKEDRTLVMGLEEPENLPRIGQERNEILKGVAMEFCKAVNPTFDGTILYAGTCGRSINRKMRLEFRLESAEQAREIRKIFAVERAARRIKPELANLQVMTMVTLATRIRMDIMKAIAKRIETNEESAYVPNFLSRPIMHIKKKTKEGETDRPGSFVKTLTFVESVCLHGRALKRGDLDTAQGKANGHFRGTMRQHFLLLEEIDEGGRGGSSMWAAGTTSGTTGSGPKPSSDLPGKPGNRGLKRPLAEEGGSGTGKVSRK